MLLGVLMGALASFWATPVSFLFEFANEIILTFVFHHLSQELSACLGIPFAFFVFHYVIGFVGGAVAGLLAGLLLSLLRIRLQQLVALYVTILLLPSTFMYGYLWLLHGRFSGGDQTKGVVLTFVVALIVAVLGGGCVLVLQRIGKTIPRAARIAFGAKLFGAFVTIVLIIAFLIGVGREFGRNQTAPDTTFPSSERYDVLVIGVDGATWARLEPLMREGVLPNFTRLVDEGVTGTLRTIKRHEKHGIHDFIIKLPGAGMVPVTNESRNARAFWEIANDHGLAVDMVSWYCSWPAQEVNGVFVSDRLTYLHLDKVAIPESWMETVRHYNEQYLAARDSLLRVFTPKVKNPDWWKLDPNSLEFMENENLNLLDLAYYKDLVAFNTARDLLDRGQPNILAVYFEGIDRTFHKYIGHEIARLHRGIARRIYPTITDDDLLIYDNVVRRYHMQVDEWIGELLDRVDDQTAVVVVSDHGFGLRTPWEYKLRVNLFLETMGFLSHDSPDSRNVSWEDTKLHGFRDWSVGGLGRFFVALEGREKFGKVSPEEAPVVLDEAYKVFTELETRSGKPLFRSVKMGPKAGQNESQGDIIVHLNPDCLADTLVYQGRVTPVSSFTRLLWKPGNHRIDGIVIGKGGPFQRGKKIHGAGIMDVAPTLLTLLGIPAARDMDGRCLDRAFDSDFREIMVRGVVLTYEVEGEEDDERTPSTADEEILRKLKSLGYID
jgi:predicted AlkP superfamily phosphohydrolase/phosphomutase